MNITREANKNLKTLRNIYLYLHIYECSHATIVTFVKISYLLKLVQNSYFKLLTSSCLRQTACLKFARSRHLRKYSAPSDTNANNGIPQCFHSIFFFHISTTGRFPFPTISFHFQLMPRWYKIQNYFLKLFVNLSAFYSFSVDSTVRWFDIEKWFSMIRENF